MFKVSMKTKLLTICLLLFSSQVFADGYKLEDVKRTIEKIEHIIKTSGETPKLKNDLKKLKDYYRAEKKAAKCAKKSSSAKSEFSAKKMYEICMRE